MEMNEIVYILINDAMPGFVKIGKTTTSLEQRIRELSASTSVPLPFTCFYASRVNDASFVEKRLHEAFDDRRVNTKREFFKMIPEQVVAALRLAEIENITPKKDIVDSQEDQKALNIVRAEIRAKFSFEKAQVPIGAELIFSRDENIKARVISNKNIEFNGETTSLSTSAQKILGYEYGVQGTAL